MKALLRLISDGLAGPQSAGRTGFLCIAPVLLIRNLQFLAPEWTGDIRFFLLAAIGAVLIAGTVLWASTRLLVPNRHVRPSRPWVVLFCYLLAGVANWYVLRIAEPNAMGPTHVGWLGGLIQSVLFVAFWLIVASSISTALAQHETTARLLQLENQDLQSTRNHVQAQLARFAAELSQRVLHELIPTLEELTVRARELRVTSTPATILAFSAQLRSVAHDSIRPVAHRLDAELIDTGTLTRSPAEPVAARPQNRLAAITRLALTGDPRPVGAATVGALVAILTVAAPKLAIPYLVVAVPTNMAVLYAFRAAIPARIWNRSLPLSAALLSLAYAVAGACSIFCIPIVGLTRLRLRPRTLISSGSCGRFRWRSQGSSADGVGLSAAALPSGSLRRTVICWPLSSPNSGKSANSKPASPTFGAGSHTSSTLTCRARSQGVGSCCSAQPKSPTKMCQRRWIARFCVWSKH